MRSSLNQNRMPSARSSTETADAVRSSDSRSPAGMATRSAVLLLALAGTLVAFDVGLHAGAALNGRVMAVSVARVPMPLLARPDTSPVHTHVR